MPADDETLQELSKDSGVPFDSLERDSDLFTFLLGDPFYYRAMLWVGQKYGRRDKTVAANVHKFFNDVENRDFVLGQIMREKMGNNWADKQTTLFDKDKLTLNKDILDPMWEDQFVYEK